MRDEEPGGRPPPPPIAWEMEPIGLTGTQLVIAVLIPLISIAALTTVVVAFSLLVVALS